MERLEFLLSHDCVVLENQTWLYDMFYVFLFKCIRFAIFVSGPNITVT